MDRGGEQVRMPDYKQDIWTFVSFAILLEVVAYTGNYLGFKNLQIYTLFLDYGEKVLTEGEVDEVLPECHVAEAPSWPRAVWYQKVEMDRSRACLVKSLWMLICSRVVLLQLLTGFRNS
uniref:Innexin n=1 Tax=Ditylenchus dipsaci TaxID=166011 RepID=A0A915EDK9_9BILA